MNKNIKLSNGETIPMVGFGVFQTESGIVTENAVVTALKAGYGHIDTAKIYANEESVGRGIKKSGVAREDIYLTTKLWNDDIRAGNAREALKASFSKLDVDYLDLYLIHWPAVGFEEAWLVLEEYYKAGKIKTIGVSNFHKHHLDELKRVATIMPMVNQIESNPYFNNFELVKYCQSLGIVVEAWSPLGGTGSHIFENPTLIELGKKYGKDVAQIIIRWHLQNNIVALVKSVNDDRIKSNINVYDFELSKEDMDIINSLERNQRSGADPETFDF